MCGRFVQASGAKQLFERMDLPSGSLFDRPRFNVAPTTAIAAIREGRNGCREIVALKWGLIPSFLGERAAGGCFWASSSRRVFVCYADCHCPVRVP